MSRYAYAAALVVSLGLSAAACSKQGNGATAAAAQSDSKGGGGGAGGSGARGGGGRRGAGGPVPVLTTKVQAKNVPVTIPAVGTAEPTTTVQVRAQVTGQLSALHFTEGQDVRKGQ